MVKKTRKIYKKEQPQTRTKPNIRQNKKRRI